MVGTPLPGAPHRALPNNFLVDRLAGVRYGRQLDGRGALEPHADAARPGELQRHLACLLWR
jgi:hypothetical protein